MTTTRKEGDTEPIRATLLQSNRRPVQLSGTVLMIAVPDMAGIGVGMSKASTIVGDPLDGEVETEMLTTDLPASGTPGGRAVYRVVYEVTFGDGTIKTYPTKGYERIVIEDDLG